MPYYAVSIGREVKGGNSVHGGLLFKKWSQCKKSVHGYKRNRFKKFNSRKSAANWLKSCDNKIESRSNRSQNSNKKYGGRKTIRRRKDRPNMETVKLSLETMNENYEEVEGGGIKVGGIYFWPNVSRWSKTNRKPKTDRQKCSFRQFLKKL